jgi:MFS family permease
MLLAILLVASSNSLAVDYAAMLALGVGSGAAMIPYTVIKEVNPDRFMGSATGIMNFLTFTVTAVVGPIFAHLFGASLASSSDHAAHFRGASLFWIAVIVLAIVVSLVLRETGAARSTSRMKPKLNPG